MLLGCSTPVADIGTCPVVLRDLAQAAEGRGDAHLLAPDHVLGPDAAQGGFASSAAVAASFNANYRRVGTTGNAYRDPFRLFGFLSGCTERIGFAAGVLTTTYMSDHHRRIAGIDAAERLAAITRYRAAVADLL